jgi:hypothetical protein
MGFLPDAMTVTPYSSVLKFTSSLKGTVRRINCSDPTPRSRPAIDTLSLDPRWRDRMRGPGGTGHPGRGGTSGTIAAHLLQVIVVEGINQL